MKKTKVAVAMGGYSSEVGVSLQSGAVVVEALKASTYDVYPVHILEEGWHYVAPDGSTSALDRSDFSFIAEGAKVVPDVVFNTIHGTPGEDGLMAAYWDVLGIRHTSAEFYPAALSFNKRDCLSVLKHFGIRTANSYYVNRGDHFNLEMIVKMTGIPCFVKPNRAGSSYGISRVSDMAQLAPAIDKAFEEDNELLIETEIKGTEVSVGVYRYKGDIHVLPVTEIISENEFFDFEAKYQGKSQEITPARISEKETEIVQQEARKIFHLLNLTGVARADFIIENGVPHFIEINTTPGLSTESIIPKMAREAKMTLTQFFGMMVEEALTKKA